jgi:hypothetical protein
MASRLIHEPTVPKRGTMYYQTPIGNSIAPRIHHGHNALLLETFSTEASF